MNRPIKFRAWVNDAMVYDIQEEYDTLGYRVKVYKNNSLIESGDYRQTTFTDYFEYPVMQFTGMLDKNGKEIYEGDIVQLKNNEEDELGLLKKFNHIGQIFWAHGNAGFAILYNQKDCVKFSLDSIGMWEVIGNQFENPELLEASDEQ